MAASAPRFSKPPAIRQVPNDSTRLFLECQVQSTPKPDITWFQNDKKILTTSTKQKQTIKVATGNNYDVTLEITKLTPEDAGTYKIIAKNKTGEVTASVNLNLSNDDEETEAKPATTER
jgi:hypothetical protein